MGISKRRLRFSIGAVLVLMTGVAVLLNHEVQRVKAIEETVNIVGKQAKLIFGSRKSVPSYIVELLPYYWGQEIVEVHLNLFTPALSAVRESGPFDMREEFKSLIDLGAFQNVKKARLMGDAIDFSLTSKLCTFSSIESCSLEYTALSKDQVNGLKKLFPHCKFRVIERSTVESPN